MDPRRRGIPDNQLDAEELIDLLENQAWDVQTGILELDLQRRRLLRRASPSNQTEALHLLDLIGQLEQIAQEMEEYVDRILVAHPNLLPPNYDPEDLFLDLEDVHEDLLFNDPIDFNEDLLDP